jgi:hypothetical protein
MRRIAVLLFLFCVVSFAPAFSQTLTGTWSGTWMFQDAPDGPSRCCQNLPDPIVHGGAMTMSFTSESTGTALLSGLKQKQNNESCPTNQCILVDSTAVLPVTASLTGSTVTGTFVEPTGDSLTFTATIANDVMTGTVRGEEGASGLFSVTRGTQNTADGSGTWSGDYHLTDRCPHTSAGSMTANLTQYAADTLLGTVTLAGLKSADENCNLVSTGTVNFNFTGYVTGTTVNAVIITSAGIPAILEGQLNGDMFTGQILGWEGSGSGPFSMTRTGGGSTPTGSFIATPNIVAAGRPVTLSWSVGGATSVSIEPGVGNRPPAGTAVVSPTASTTYTLTAFGPSGGSITLTTRVEVISIPDIQVSLLPTGIVQLANTGGASTTFALTNAGGAAAQIALAQSGDFFTITPSGFTIGPGESQVITVTTQARPAGDFTGSVTLSVAGISVNVTVPVRLLSAAPPAGLAAAAARIPRVDVAGDPGTQPSGVAQFRNNGTGTVTALASSGVPWLIVSGGVITIAPGATVDVPFSVDRSRRPDGDAPIGSQRGEIILTYLRGGAGKLAALADEDTSKSQVTVVDTARPAVAASALPTGAAASRLLMIPGVRQGADLVSDLAISKEPGHEATNVQIFYLPSDGNPASALSTTVTQSVQKGSVSLGGVVKSTFQHDNEIGTLAVLAEPSDSISVHATLIDVARSAGTALPVFRGDRSLVPGASLILTGLRGDPGRTDLAIQETSGSAATVMITFRNEAGAPVNTREVVLAAHSLASLTNAVPAGAVSAEVTNSSASLGRVVAYALPTDTISGDRWVVTDWKKRTASAPQEPAIIPVAGVVRGRNNSDYRTEVSMMNTGSAVETGTLRYFTNGEMTERTISLGPNQSRVFSDLLRTEFGVTGNSLGYLKFIPTTGGIHVNSRTYHSAAGSTFSADLPVVPVSDAIRLGEVTHIGELEDAMLTTIIASRPSTFRSNLGLVETEGAAVTVRATLRYTFVTGKGESRGTAVKDFSLEPSGFLFFNNLAREIIGPSRESAFRDLKDLQLDVQVVDGTGGVIVVTSTVENATNDSIVRVE